MTIKTKVLLSYLLMLLIPALVVTGAGHMLQTYFRGDSEVFAGRQTPFTRVARHMNAASRAINLRILEDPDGFLDPAVIQGLSPPLKDLGFVVRRGREIVTLSESLIRVGLPTLPPFGVVTPWEPPWELPPEPVVASQWDFRFSDGTEGSLFLVTRPRPGVPRPLLGFSQWIVGLAVVILVIANGLVTFLIYRNMVRPVGLLEAATRRISSGDLETPLKDTRPRNDEIGRVHRAFEDMRIRLRESLIRQQQYEDSRRELIANISHDLRTPVTAIRGYVEGIRDGVADTPEKQDRYLSTISDKAAVVDRLIEELFLLSTLDLNAVPFDFRTIDLAAFLADSVEELRLRHEPAGITISLESVAGVTVPVRVDAARLRRVLENIVDNAVRHGDKEKPQVILHLERLDDRSLVTVRDNGPGIPQETLPHIFDRFYRGDDSRTTEGSGLGLAIAKSLVEAHAGSIRAECPREGGTRMVITLPLSKEPVG